MSMCAKPIVRNWARPQGITFSAGPDGQLLPLTVANLKQAFSQNHKFRDSLDPSQATRQKLERFDKDHEIFEVNYLLKASHAHGPGKSQPTTLP